jgi:hypothetical protein
MDVTLIGMPVASFVTLTPARAAAMMGAAGAMPAGRSARFVRCRMVEKVAPQHGEKPYEQLVADAFHGPVLRLSEKLKLLEEADARRIRRGDALELMASVQGQLEAALAVRQPSKTAIFLRRFIIFALAYGAVAVAACVMIGR